MTDLSVLAGADNSELIGNLSRIVGNAKPPRRTRSFRRRATFEPQTIVDRVMDFVTKDQEQRTWDTALRLQRRAKLRQWSEGKDEPWPDSSDIALPDMATASYRMQDTLYNAFLAQTPPIGAKSVTPENRDKEESIDRLIYAQFFLEQDGEEALGHGAQQFVDEGVAYAYVPWIKERTKVMDVRLFDPIPSDMLPFDYFRALLVRNFPEWEAIPFAGDERNFDGFDWRLFRPNTALNPDEAMQLEEFDVSFYTRRDGKVMMRAVRLEVVFDGPRALIYDYEDVMFPATAANLQMPSPANPRGASHVILRDRPTIDEITKLARRDFYDMIDADTLEQLPVRRLDETWRELDHQKSEFQGMSDDHQRSIDAAKSHNQLTVLKCFDQFDVDGDGLDEDVIWWVQPETKTLLRWRHLTESFPVGPPRRPIVSQSMFPVHGRVTGIGMPEIMESTHDTMKVMIDQEINYVHITSSPWFFYRSTGSMKQEILRMWPGEGYPLADPQKDVAFPQFPQRDSAATLNLFGLLSQQQEKLTMVGDLQLGRVPVGRSSALRTIGGIALLSGQGEARPERVLRRFFTFWAEVWRHFHELNQQFIPRDKVIRIVGARPGDDPYVKIEGRESITGRFDFEFVANAFNASRQAQQQALEALLGVYITPYAIQTGITSIDGAYRLLRDFGKAHGQTPDRYIQEPVPGARKQPIFMEGAIQMIMSNFAPDGTPGEAGGAIEHLQKLDAFSSGDDFGLLTPGQVGLFQGWLRLVQELARGQAEAEQLQQAAGQFQQGRQGGPVGAPPQGAPPDANAPQTAGPNELIDETLPGAGGGAAAAQ